MYHTQEKWENTLLQPMICTAFDAWLGSGYYFWYDQEDAYYWGQKKKRLKGYFEVYSAEIYCDNILDTVFNEEHYTFWLYVVNKAIVRFAKAGIKASIKDINDYFKDKGVWAKFDGVMFQDISTSKVKNVIPMFFYKKRIQLAVYNLSIITNFALLSEYKCV